MHGSVSGLLCFIDHFYMSYYNVTSVHLHFLKDLKCHCVTKFQHVLVSVSEVSSLHCTYVHQYHILFIAISEQYIYFF